MNLHITKSKNAESFYICRSYAKDNGSTTSTIVRKLGTLENLLNRHSPVNTRVAAIFSFTNCQRRDYITAFFLRQDDIILQITAV